MAESPQSLSELCVQLEDAITHAKDLGYEGVRCSLNLDVATELVRIISASESEGEKHEKV